MSAPQAGPLRMMGTLGLAGMISGLAIVGIFLLTQPRIERNRAEALEAAIFRVLHGASSRVAYVMRGSKLVPFESANGGLPKEPAVYAGYDASGKLVGFAIPAEGAGFQDTIQLIYGFDAKTRRVVGMEVLESRETPGLGDKIIKDSKFLANFHDLAVDPKVVVVKSGKKTDNEVDAISGATISSKAVVKIINDSNQRWLDRVEALAKTIGNGGGPK